MQAIQILLCDDHPIFREGIRSTLSGQDEVFIAAEAANGHECLDALAVQAIDVVLLDINMPEMDGIECLMKIRDAFPDVKVLALTQYDEKRFVKQMMKFGASGYLLKSTSRVELVKAIKSASKGGTYLAEEAGNRLEDLDTIEAPNALFPSLTDREKDIIRCLSNGLSTRETAEELFLSAHTVETHRGNIFKKIGINNVAALVRWAVNNGFD